MTDGDLLNIGYDAGNLTLTNGITGNLNIAGNLTVEGLTTNGNLNLTSAGIDLSDQNVEINIGDNNNVVCVGKDGEDNKVNVNGDLIVSGEVTCSSDASLKTNIRNIDDAEEKLLALNGVAFDWIESGKSTYGIIAQDVEEILPKLYLV